jgi:hypothetical protein
MRQLDFSNGKVEVLTLDELKATQTENYSNTQTPVGGIYHFDLIRRIVDHLDQAGLNPEIQEIFAANNADRYRPGVTVNQDLFREYGDFAVHFQRLQEVVDHLDFLTLLWCRLGHQFDQFAGHGRIVVAQIALEFFIDVLRKPVIGTNVIGIPRLEPTALGSANIQLIFLFPHK